MSVLLADTQQKIVMYVVEKFNSSSRVRGFFIATLKVLKLRLQHLEGPSRHPVQCVTVFGPF